MRNDRRKADDKVYKGVAEAVLSDWGWTTKETQAILLSPHWRRRFTAFLNRDANRTGGLR